MLKRTVRPEAGAEPEVAGGSRLFAGGAPGGGSDLPAPRGPWAERQHSTVSSSAQSWLWVSLLPKYHLPPLFLSPGTYCRLSHLSPDSSSILYLRGTSWAWISAVTQRHLSACRGPTTQRDSGCSLSAEPSGKNAGAALTDAPGFRLSRRRK